MVPDAAFLLCLTTIACYGQATHLLGVSCVLTPLDDPWFTTPSDVLNRLRGSN